MPIKTKTQQGFTSVEFLFALIISATFCMLMFAVCFTFTVVEISQYIAFSVSRSHMAGHIDQDAQENMAKNKFTALVKNPVLAPLFSNGWFELTGPEIRGGGSRQTFADQYPQNNSAAQVGVRLLFNAKLLVIKTPLLGSTTSGDNEFTAHVTGLLIREPTTKECQDQLKRDVRYRALLDLDAGRFNIARPSADKYVAMEDNGC